MENMDIWNALSVTDPQHTKKFTRAGGFKGNAIKPMYAIQKMTERFGACGIGWGYTKPEYQIVSGTDGQVLVYCTVGLWHTGDPENRNPAYDESAFVWGVGGDFVIVKQATGLRSDDEAFKKAFTDALMNAMKHIGMSADVHMGQFDGSKYSPNQDEPKPIPKQLSTERKGALVTMMLNANTPEKLKAIQDGVKKECENDGTVQDYKDIIAAVKAEKPKPHKQESNN
ncbi:hypothetical protein J0X19_11680 [Hymenobacter sp. BT186]|uniref:Uncharacterized protein n=1 Tax=Hymenobacter telluris TaxID=2816474 RepID=A0A939EWC0_9BACT|nr:hypothetical protein [Hymenobacter telluris]MBO0358608.1 hypothetical protein [Hymenobacter telluris]MBW3374634.1 hypothetical protein [Hymenobacter norwichensis]